MNANFHTVLLCSLIIIRNALMEFGPLYFWLAPSMYEEIPKEAAVGDGLGDSGENFSKKKTN